MLDIFRISSKIGLLFSPLLMSSIVLLGGIGSLVENWNIVLLLNTILSTFSWGWLTLGRSLMAARLMHFLDKISFILIIKIFGTVMAWLCTAVYNEGIRQNLINKAQGEGFQEV